MAWRASYSVLREIFPQVDARLIKGAALDHGDDLGSAADFILNEVLCPEDDISGQEQPTVSVSETLPSDFLSRGPNSGDRSVAANVSGAESSTRILTSGFSESRSKNSANNAEDDPDGSQDASSGLTRASPNTRMPLVIPKQEEEAVLPVIFCGVTCAIVDSPSLDAEKIEVPPQLFPRSELGTEDTPRSSLGASSMGGHNSEDEPLVESSGKLKVVEPETIGDKTNDSLEMCSTETTNPQGVSGTEEKDENLEHSMTQTICVGSTYTDPGNSIMENSDLRDGEELEGEMVGDSAYDSVLVSRSKVEINSVVEEHELEMMTSTKISFDEEDETEGGCWETVSNTSTQMASMETLLDAVEQAKADKEVLISSIEELRALRQKTDEVEYAARVAKDEAEKGGVDIMAQVSEMRQMLSRAREANEVHAAEVHGEKAVLATEARELRSRLVQLKTEKEKALSVLNEIKASLQARIDKAFQERESAIGEKAAKEALARECLIQEEAFMAKVAQESRELQAETETCNMLREFLIERGNIVDALQGEVGVLCEDAEELKEEIERMNLSSSSGYVHMLRPRPLTDNNNSLFSRSTKSVVSGEGVAHFLEGVEQVDFAFDGAIGAHSPARSLVTGHRSAGDKRLPSLRRALSGSQDFSGSSHSSVNSASVASNSAVGMRSVTKVSPDIDEGSRIPEDKYVSPQSSQSGSEVERTLYQAQMAMFPDESDLLDYRTSNLDIFRTEISRTTKEATGANSDEDDWHLLDLTVRQKHTSSESSCSSYIGK